MRRVLGAPWHVHTSGTGSPLVLLHGLGMSHGVWGAVQPLLSESRRVFAFDIAGFGATPPLPPGVDPTAGRLADALIATFDALGLLEPVDVAGNSLGGAIALEVAKRGRARTVVAISPAGLWRRQPPFHVRYVFGALWHGARHAPSLVVGAMRRRLLRELLLTVPMSVGSGRMPATDAVRAIDDLRFSTAFAETFEHTRAPFAGGAAITVPVTVAFGRRDWILPEWSRVRDELPAHVRWIEPEGWGHVPFWIDPAGAADLILEGSRV